MMFTTKFPVLAAGLAFVVTGCLLFAQEPPSPRAGRGGRAGRGAAPARGAGRSPDKFPQFTRPLASQDVLLRGKQLYNANCAGCHAADMRGVSGKGNNLLRSPVAMEDQHGELVMANLARHNPPVHLVETDGVAVSEYIHSILAIMGAQGSPPGRNPVGLNLNLLVGDPQAGKAYFDAHCAGCHSVTGDLRGIGAKYEGNVAGLQNTWVSGSSGSGRGGRGGGARKVTVTTQNGQKIEGTLVREDDFLVVFNLADGTRRAMSIEDGWPKVEVEDPQAAHKKMVLELDDPQNRNMHDVTAYLATLK
jgi:cytochrome c oxidase cbb3-type subunit 3